MRYLLPSLIAVNKALLGPALTGALMRLFPRVRGGTPLRNDLERVMEPYCPHQATGQCNKCWLAEQNRLNKR
jgi:hypothetical protein